MPETVPDKYQQLAWEFGQAALERRPMDRAPEVYRAIGHQMTARMASLKYPINSAAAVELAFEAALNDFKELMPVYAQHQLLVYIVDHAPAETIDYRPGDPYFNATVASFGVSAVFNHIVRGIVLSDPNQLVLDMGDGHGSEPSP